MKNFHLSSTKERMHASIARNGIPLCRSAVLIGLSMGIGDALCQTLEGGHVAEFRRTEVMWFIGTFISGPISHSWQVMLEGLLPGSSTRRIIQKTLSNSAFAFSISLPVMFGAVTMLAKDPRTGKQGSLKDAKEKIQRDLIPTFLAGCFYWPVFNLAIYKFVPLNSRAIANAGIGVAWNIFISMMANRKVQQQINEP